MAAGILIVVLIAAYTALVARKKYRDIKRGKFCGGCCDGCSGCKKSSSRYGNP